MGNHDGINLERMSGRHKCRIHRVLVENRHGGLWRIDGGLEIIYRVAGWR